jgi:hypothetical protein
LPPREPADAAAASSFDPLYVDVILRRYRSETGRSAVLEATGETFVENAPAAV